MTQLAFVFPGQGSQSVEMMAAWADDQSLVDSVFTEASDALGIDLSAIIREGPAEKLNQTEITQPAMLAAGVAAYRVWQHHQLKEAEVFAGHSLGEYSALVCTGSIAFADAVKLVSARGKLMQSAVPEGEGAMAAIIGLDDDNVIKACDMVDDGVVSAVNFNSPGQVVIAGNRNSVELAMQKAKELGAKRALPLPVSVPSHCALMQDAAEALSLQLADIDIYMPDKPVIHNQNAAVATSVDDIRERLKLQLFQPVLWVGCVEAINTMGINTLVEFGPGKVLTGLTRRINKSMNAHAIFDSDSLQKIQQILEEDES